MSVKHNTRLSNIFKSKINNDNEDAKNISLDIHKDFEKHSLFNVKFGVFSKHNLLC